VLLIGRTLDEHALKLNYRGAFSQGKFRIRSASFIIVLQQDDSGPSDHSGQHASEKMAGQAAVGKLAQPSSHAD
jgi:hypothetical protein